MTNKVIFILVLFVVGFQIPLKAETRRLLSSISGFKVDKGADNIIYGAGANSKFEIIETTDNEYKVMFSSIAPFDKDEAKFSILSVENAQNISTVKYNTMYKINKSDLPEYFHKFSSGGVGGIFSVPFKLINNGKVSPGATLGGFYGFKYRDVILLGADGVSSIPTSDINSKQIETKLGFTAACGIVAEPLDKFQLGIVVGIDHLGNDWQYEDRGWLSLAIGYSFTK